MQNNRPSPSNPATEPQPPVVRSDPPTLPQKLSIKSTFASEKPLTAARTIDGLFVTRWSSQGKGKWLQYDLGQKRRMTSIKIAFFQGDKRRAQFTIQLSDNKKTWTNILSGEASGTTSFFEEFELPSAEARLLRIVCNGNNLNSWNSVSEVEIWGELLDPQENM